MLVVTASSPEESSRAVGISDFSLELPVNFLSKILSGVVSDSWIRCSSSQPPRRRGLLWCLHSQEPEISHRCQPNTCVSGEGLLST